MSIEREEKEKMRSKRQNLFVAHFHSFKITINITSFIGKVHYLTHSIKFRKLSGKRSRERHECMWRGG